VAAPLFLLEEVDAERGGRRVLHGIDLELDEGATALLGPSGSGKSTLLRLLNRLADPVGGRVRFRGTDVRELEPRALRRRACMVPQTPVPLPGSVADNVRFAPALCGARADVSRALELAGLDDSYAERPADRLSVGEQQRVMLARVLALEPEVLLLDEPMAALDARTRLEVRSELRRHLSAFGGPTVLVTHDPLEAMVLADRVLVLEGGAAVQEGAPASVARRPATEYVARLVGLNLYSGVLADHRTGRVELDCGGTLLAVGRDEPDGPAVATNGGRMLVVLAPSAVALHLEEPGPGSPRNVWPARVAGLETLTDRVRIAVDGRPSALVDVTPAAVAELRLAAGQRIWLSAKATEVIAYPDRGPAPAGP
jgi:molybdate transport system ATP-binding protein